MKNFSLPRLALVLWFFIYTLLSLINYVWGTGRHGIMDFIVWTTVWVAVLLIGLGFIDDLPDSTKK